MKATQRKTVKPKPRRRSGSLIPGFEHRPNRLKSASDLQDMRWQKPLGYIQFMIDHWGLTQTRECRRHGLRAGQEPVSIDGKPGYANPIYWAAEQTKGD